MTETPIFTRNRLVGRRLKALDLERFRHGFPLPAPRDSRVGIHSPNHPTGNLLSKAHD
ncbi:MAG: hypothetical protein ACRERV_03770 [Methylococcales bacterium]